MITCQICQKQTHHIPKHLEKEHPEMSLDGYQDAYEDAPLYSEEFIQRYHERHDKAAMTATVTQLKLNTDNTVYLHELFDLGDDKQALSARGTPIPVTVLKDGEYADLVPERDKDYIFDVSKLKTVLFAIEKSLPCYIWGPSGTGKTAFARNIAAITNRPMYRVQHTINMLESDVVGDWRAKDGNTYFELGPLPLAMKNGWLYLSDEYDRAPPGVVSLYQAVLEGEPLIIKEAPPEYRCIKPHKDFKFIATGNTSGNGDDTGLYAGTVIQDAANYSRFAVTERVGYMPHDKERELLIRKANLQYADAERLVDFAKKIRSNFDAGKIGTTIGPRELLHAAMIGAAFADFKIGLQTAITNRMTELDRETSKELMQRIFG